MRPSISWYFYNLFRLVAVVFVTWALAAQFVALASDPAELSKAKSSDPSSSRSNASSVSTGPRSTARTPTSLPIQPTGLITNSLLPPASRSNVVSVAQLGPEAITTTPPLIRPTTAAGAAVQTVDSPLIVARPGERSLRKRANEGEKPTSGVYGLSSVPTSAGGPMFSSISRMIMATALGFFLLAQLGVPEMWLYRNVSAFSPQSTPLWLGVGQVIIAVEGLRVYSAPMVWSAHIGLLVIGMINSHLAIILIIMARKRKLPKTPPPPLYFSRTTRLLFFRPLPEFYIQLLSQEEQAQIEAAHAQMGQSSDLEDPMIDSGPWRLKNRHVPPPPSKDEMTDIRRGGYPTFAKGGLGAPGSQIPASTLDITPDGRMRGLIARPVGDRRSIETTADAYSGVADDSRAPSRNESVDERKGSKSSEVSARGKRKPPPLGLSPVGDHSHPERRQFERTRSITALKEKIHQRMERQDPTNGDGNAGLTGQNDVPTITTTAPSAGLSALHTTGARRSSTVDTANTFGRQPTILRSIPKRGNTISQSIAPSRPPFSERPSTQSQPGGAGPTAIPIPAPASKSPTGKSITESTASSSLPWTKSSAPASPVKSVPAVSKSGNTDVPSERQTTVLQSAKPVVPVQVTLGDSSHGAPTEMRHVSRSSLQVPAATVTRTPSGSKLQKSRKVDSSLRSPRSSSSPLNDRSLRDPGIPDTMELGRQVSVRGGGLMPASIKGSGERPSNTLKKRASPSPTPVSPVATSPVSPPIRPQSADTTLAIQSSLRSSMAPLNRKGSIQSTRSARTAMGVRFDLEKRYSTSSSSSSDELADHESLLSPETRSGHSTPRSAGFRIPGTRLFVPFPGTPRKMKGARPMSDATSISTSSPDPRSGDHRNRQTGLLLEMDDLEDEIEAVRPESFASQSTINSMREKSGQVLDPGRGEIEDRKSMIGDRAGLPKRAASVAIESKPVGAREDPVLGGRYIDGGREHNWKRGHARRPSSISIDPRQSVAFR